MILKKIFKKIPTEVSIVVPVFNHEKFLNQLLNSLIAQTYPNLELILINDGSSDCSFQILEDRKADCEKRFSRVTIVNQDNKGVAAVQNLGIAIARNEILFFIASDDIVLPEAIAKLVSKICSDNSIAAVFTDSVFIDEDGDFLPISVGNQNFSSYRNYLAFLRPDVNFKKNFGSYSTLLNGNYLGIGIIARKSCILKVGGYDETSSMEDYDLWLKLSKKYKLLFLDEVLTHYRWHGNNSSVIRRKEIHFSEILLLLRETPEFIRLGLIEAWNKRILDALYGYKAIRDNEIKGFSLLQNYEFKMINWGPRTCKAGEIPNIQPDGTMGIWISLESSDGCRSGCQLIFNGIPALLTNIQANLITAKVAGEQLNSKGLFKVQIQKEFEGGRTFFDIGFFTIT